MLKDNVEKVNAEIKECPSTIFDTFEVGVDLREVGGALRDRLSDLANVYARINQLASNALLLFEKAKNRRDKVESIAWDEINAFDKRMTASDKKLAVRTVKVNIDGESTTLSEEDDRVNIYSYVAKRGKDKVKEVSSAIDLARTLLSWDKQEQSRS